VRGGRLLIGLCVAAGLGVAVGALLWAGDGDRDAQMSRGTASPADGRLYVLESRRAWVRPVSHGKWELSLVQPRVLWFADRPIRASGTIDAQRLAGVWRHAFAGDPPNGAIVAPDVPDGSQPTALIVSAPRVADSVVSFRIAADEGMRDASVAWLSRLTRGHADQTGGVAFFIDEGGEEINELHVEGPDGLVWNEEESQCAGYGSVVQGEAFSVYFETNNSGSCFFKPTYARFDVLDEKGAKVGTATFGGTPGDLWCTTELVCSTEVDPSRGSGFAEWFYTVDYKGDIGSP
jgi:hypothetical protein